MESFRSDIKFQILIAAGVTPRRYDRIRSALFRKKEYEYDSIDEAVVSTASLLETRYQLAFSLLYDCHTEKETMQRMRWKESTLATYMKISKKTIIDNILRNQEKLDLLLKNIRAYETQIQSGSTSR